jgi:thiol-disulfide isomerase/thioredoxin
MINGHPRIRISVVSAILPAVFLLAVSSYAAPPHASLLHKPAPIFVRNDLANHPVDLAASRGRVVLLNFWATWCTPCQIEIPRFIAWQSKYGPKGLEIIGVSMDDDAAPVRSMVGQSGVNYPVVMGDARLGLQYGGVLGLPVTYLIDRRGIVRARFKGEANLDRMEIALRQLLSAP